MMDVVLRNRMETPKCRAAPSTAREDAEILAEIARGDMRRFAALVDRYKKRLASYVGHRVADRHHVEDLVQEAFWRMFRSARIGGYDGRAAVSTWLFTIADNCVTDHLRAAGRRPASLETDAPRSDRDRAPSFDRCPSREPDPSDAAQRSESQCRADALLSRLPEPQRRVVALKVLGELTLQEIADVVGCPLGTVKSRLLYGLRKIEQALQESPTPRGEG
jgi:RNA polymerase sigma-70 factor, ECF subfamily